MLQALNRWCRALFRAAQIAKLYTTPKRGGKKDRRVPQEWQAMGSGKVFHEQTEWYIANFLVSFLQVSKFYFDRTASQILRFDIFL